MNYIPFQNLGELKNITSGLRRGNFWGSARHFLFFLIGLFGFASVTIAQIPPSERTVLDNIYVNTGGGTSWVFSTNWEGAPGSECAWFGITCDGSNAHVVGVDLSGNGLNGVLPAINDLTEVQTLNFSGNAISGTIPSLAGLTSLTVFTFSDTQVSGDIPDLAGLVSLQYFFMNENVNLNGKIPALTGLTALTYFSVSNNALTGNVPKLTGLNSLQEFDVGRNQLTGTMPALTGLTSLTGISVYLNKLNGPVPDVPNPSALREGGSDLCPNYFTPSDNSAWDLATGSIPWYSGCDGIFIDGFDLP
jgi:hypothetical protein